VADNDKSSKNIYVVEKVIMKNKNGPNEIQNLCCFRKGQNLIFVLFFCSQVASSMPFEIR